MEEKIKGPALSQEQIGVINEIKTVETAVLKLINSIKDQDIMPVDKRWIAIGTTDIEKGFISCFKKKLEIEEYNNGSGPNIRTTRVKKSEVVLN